MGTVFDLILNQFLNVYSILHSATITWDFGDGEVSVSYWALLVAYLVLQVFVDLVFFFVRFSIYDSDSD